MKYSASLSRIPWNNAEDASCQVLLMSAGLFSGEENVLGLHVPFCPGQEVSGTCLAVLSHLCGTSATCPVSPILSEKLQGGGHCDLDDH